MKSVRTSMKNMQWNRIIKVALPISVLFLAQACNPRYANNNVNPVLSVAETSVTSPANNIRN